MVARRAAALVLAAALATGLAACGGGDDEDRSDEVQLEDVESDANDNSSSDDSADDEEATDDTSGDEESTDDTGIDEDVIEGAFSEGCGEFAAVFGSLGGAITGNFDPEAEATFQDFVEQAPDDIQDDFETIAAAYDELNAALEEAGFDPEDPTSFDPSDPESLAALTEASQLLATPEFQEANLAISDFVASGCEG